MSESPQDFVFESWEEIRFESSLCFPVKDTVPPEEIPYELPEEILFHSPESMLSESSGFEEILFWSGILYQSPEGILFEYSCSNIFDRILLESPEGLLFELAKELEYGRDFIARSGRYSVRITGRNSFRIFWKHFDWITGKFSALNIFCSNYRERNLSQSLTRIQLY